MQASNNQINTDKDHVALPSLGNAPKAKNLLNPAPGTREHVEMVLETLKGANITATIRALNGIERGAYRVSITQDAEWNEVQVRLKEGPAGRNPIATGFVDRGHTIESKFAAAEDVRDLVRAYLCR